MLVPIIYYKPGCLHCKSAQGGPKGRSESETLLQADMQRGIVTVRSGKGDKDRTTILPDMLKPELTMHLGAIRKIYEEDRVQNVPGVYLPNALERMPTRSGTGSGSSHRQVLPLILACSSSDDTPCTHQFSRKHSS